MRYMCAVLVFDTVPDSVLLILRVEPVQHDHSYKILISGESELVARILKKKFQGSFDGGSEESLTTLFRLQMEGL
jgi:hypothetical protein